MSNSAATIRAKNQVHQMRAISTYYHLRLAQTKAKSSLSRHSALPRLFQYQKLRIIELTNPSNPTNRFLYNWYGAPGFGSALLLVLTWTLLNTEHSLDLGSFS